LKSSFKSAAKRTLEGVVVLALVFLAFLAILTTLNKVFPTGQSLFDLVRPSGDYRDRTSEKSRSRELHLATQSGEQVLAENTSATAILSMLHNTVKSKRASQIAWQSAAKGMVLYNRDAIQTFGKSTARLSFDGGNFLEVHEDSLVIVRKMERDPFLEQNRTVVVLVDGELTGQVGKKRQESFDLQVVAPGAVAKVLSPEDKTRPVRFKMAVKPDESSILTVLEGTADLVVEGKSLKIGANQIVKAQPGKAPVYLSPPPESPTLLSPAQDAMFSFRDIPPIVSFVWEGPGQAVKYHFLLAADREFENIVHDEVRSEAGFSHRNLNPGEYFWRVGTISSDQKSRLSSVRRLVLIQDLKPPRLEVHYPETPVHTSSLELTGTTEPEAKVYVSGALVSTNKRGEFTCSLTLQNGPNVIVVEAVDKVGNVAYLSQIVNGEF